MTEIINKYYCFDDKTKCTDVINISKGYYKISVFVPLEIKKDKMRLIVVNRSDTNTEIDCLIHLNETLFTTIKYDSTIQIYNKTKQNLKCNLLVKEIHSNYLKYQ